MAESIMDELEAEDEEISDEIEDESEELEDASTSDETDDPDSDRQLESFEKTKKGLLTALKSERTKRQATEAKVDAMESQLNTVAGLVESAKEKKAQPKDSGKLQVQFDDDGNAFIPTDSLAEVVEQRIKPIKDRIDHTSIEAKQAEVRNTAMAAVNSLVNENAAYPDAMKLVTKQWDWMKAEVEEKSVMDQLPKNPNDVVEFILESDIAEEFKGRFPDSDIELLMEAFTTESTGTMKRKLRKLLKTNAGEAKGMPTKLKMLAKKPKFGSASNKRRSGSPSLDDIADMDMDDFMSMSDAEIRKIDSVLRKQED